MQAFHYFTHYTDDALHLKALVSALEDILPLPQVYHRRIHLVHSSFHHRDHTPGKLVLPSDTTL